MIPAIPIMSGLIVKWAGRIGLLWIGASTWNTLGDLLSSLIPSQDKKGVTLTPAGVAVLLGVGATLITGVLACGAWLLWRSSRHYSRPSWRGGYLVN